MMSVETDVASHYTEGTLEQRILAAPLQAGKIRTGSILMISHRWTSFTMVAERRQRLSRPGLTCNPACICSGSEVRRAISFGTKAVG
jgi:hypothetical protein